MPGPLPVAAGDDGESVKDLVREIDFTVKAPPGEAGCGTVGASGRTRACAG